MLQAAGREHASGWRVPRSFPPRHRAGLAGPQGCHSTRQTVAAAPASGASRPPYLPPPRAPHTLDRAARLAAAAARPHPHVMSGQERGSPVQPRRGRCRRGRWRHSAPWSLAPWCRPRHRRRTPARCDSSSVSMARILQNTTSCGLSVLRVSVLVRRTTTLFYEQLHSRGWRIRGGPPGGAAGRAGAAAGAPAAVGLGNSWLRGANNPHDFIF